ncbi:alkaline phosphatase family protein [Brachybacterium fresconis]|uniref:AlkP superfamily pyrophosphatase or phosphodiesterase n=1 Tax=Brachybacterium fresconis TaxID=173363 RepID=A0ABS4YFN2_9MICO|nr:alkaline phosphatase family protein [Brachybacterium fresconis]MBP2407571.1 putative AlkP superfamily pyrophosphatase or phosphodiesterase [Brachybacterium fresconis]
MKLPEAGTNPAVGRPDDGGLRPKVLVVGWDGVRDDRARQLAPPALSALAAQGRWWSTTLPDIDVAPTVTAVGWSTILTGVWPDAHGVMGNEEELNRLHRYPELLTTAFCARPELNTYGAASALIFGTDFGPGPLFGPGVGTVDWVDRREFPGKFTETDPIILEAAERHFRDEDPDIAFVYLGETDQIAHEHGVGTEYDAAILRQDERLGRLVAALRARPTWASERWLLMVTTDHGHLDEGGHGKGSWEERQSFVVGAILGDGAPPIGEPLPAGGAPRAGSAEGWAVTAENIDIAPTALAHLGLPPSARHAGTDLHTR